MANDIELVSDGDGLAVLGASADVERFLHSAGIDQAPNRELNVHRLSSLLGTGGAMPQVGSNVAANSGRWVKLTADSAKAMKEFGLEAVPFVTASTTAGATTEPGPAKAGAANPAAGGRSRQRHRPRTSWLVLHGVAPPVANLALSLSQDPASASTPRPSHRRNLPGTNQNMEVGSKKCHSFGLRMFDTTPISVSR